MRDLRRSFFAGMTYTAADERYDSMLYRRCGRSGLDLPAISLGLWHNFGDDRPIDTSRAILRRAFDLGITHFDLANNYGPPYGSAEINFGRVLKEDLRPYRDELIISTKAGWDMWPGPYGDRGSRKYLVASLDQSLQRMGLDYVDIFYSHRADPDTPLEETMGALDTAVRQGKALYAGVSSIHRSEPSGRGDPPRAGHSADHPPALLLDAQPLDRGRAPRRARRPRHRLHRLHPARPGMLTDRYLDGIPADSRAARDDSLDPGWLSEENLERIRALNAIASNRGQSLAQLALAWTLRDPRVTSTLVGASSVRQLEQNVAALDSLEIASDELAEIDRHAGEGGVNLWAESAEAE